VDGIGENNGTKRMSETAADFEFLAVQMAEAETGWSLGTFGAIAEFTRDPDEPVVLGRDASSLSAVTGRGGIRIVRIESLRLFASESPTRESWNQRVSLCLPDDGCHASGRTVLTELGPDAEALRGSDRDAILFDLGLDTVQADICVRTADAAVIAALRSEVGRSLFTPGNSAMGTILAASPHRVFISRCGRLEVFQPIPPADGRSPEGPHTHVLPRLLQHRRTHSATEPVPDGLVPCAHLYPAHPTKDQMGRARPFDPGRHAAFQQVLGRFGDPRTLALKQRVIAAVAANEDPAVIPVTNDRFARAGIRIVMRQLNAANGSAPNVPAWLAAHERTDEADADLEADVERDGH
jgi:hypothetical protein